MQADNRAILMAGGFPLNVLTALTLQTPRGVIRVEPVPADFVEQQMRTLLQAYPVGAIKIGMLATGETVRGVCRVLQEFSEVPSVLDPVFSSTSGHDLLERSGMDDLRDQLIPLVDLITPNLDELAILLGRKIVGRSDILAGGAELAQRVRRAILVKGGHSESHGCDDFLFEPNKKYSTFTAPRVNSRNTRGTGCALSAWIATKLACGSTLASSIQSAKSSLTQSLFVQANRLWVGSGPAFL